MRDIARAKGLGELRTVTTHHVASKPPRKGTTYLDLFALSMEKQRLEQELAGIERRRKRILDRLAEVRSSMEKLVGVTQQEKAVPSSCAEPGAEKQPRGEASSRRQWKKMAVDY